jgi:acetate kinase
MAQVLVINSGSSSLKYQLLDIDQEQMIAKGNVEKVGASDSFVEHKHAGTKNFIRQAVSEHQAAFELMMNAFGQFGPLLELDKIVAVGHRVVHGGTRFDQPVLIDDSVERAIDELSDLAPLHNPANLKGVRAARKVFDSKPQVAVFDTAFHQTLDPVGYSYAIDQALAQEHGIRRYGFHGTSFAYVSQTVAKFLKKPLEELNLIILHLGNGGSAAAIAGGRSVETSMGLTPLEGLVMGTRSGDIDAGVIFHLHRKLGLDFDEIDELLNRKSGLAGMSGQSADMRDLLKLAAGGDKLARLALDTYYRRVKKYIGSYMAILGRVDAIVFTGGIGERDFDARLAITSGLENLGIKIDKKLNGSDRATGIITEPRDISSKSAKVRTIVVPTNEELEIARQAYLVANSI